MPLHVLEAKGGYAPRSVLTRAARRCLGVARVVDHVSRPANWRGCHALGWVPIHDELIRCGLVAYVAQRKLDGHLKMFGTDSEAETLSASTHRVSYWFSRLAQALGLGQECNLHALRPAFIATCLRSGVSIEGIRLLVGRMVEVPASLRDLPPPPRNTEAVDQTIAWVRRLRFDSLELSHLYIDEPLCRADELFQTR